MCYGMGIWKVWGSKWEVWIFLEVLGLFYKNYSCFEMDVKCLNYRF